MTGSAARITYNYSSQICYKTNGKNTDRSSFSDKVKCKEGEKVKQESQRGTVMADYYARKPQYKATQEKRVESGYSVLSLAGISAEDMEEMSMAEFREKISEVIGSIPHHPSRPYDEETVLISGEGWESMKKDPDYAAWVVGLLKEDRSVNNPFTAMGDKGAFIVQHFGAAPDDYHGVGFSKIYGGTAAGARSMYNAECGKGGITTRAPQADFEPPEDYDLWEERRKKKRRKQKELLDEELQAKYLQRKYLNSLNQKKYFDNKALQGSGSVEDIIGARRRANMMKPAPSGGAASYEALFMTME